MADLKLYNNGEGKILFSAGDRIIRQPYDFGRSFQNRMGLNNYIIVDGLSFSNYSFLVWVNDSASASPICGTLCDTNNYNYGSLNPNSWDMRKNGWPGISSASVLAPQSGPFNLLGYGKDGINIGNLSLGKYTQPSFNSVFTDSILKRITLLAASRSVYPGEINGYANTVCKINRCVVFSRYITFGEHSYYVNNSIGNDLQSNEGLEIDLHNDFAEILDFSVLQDGSDLRVGVRDHSGNNRHGQIMNLPAGTLQEQLDWANANLFVPFIS